jgi:hypothetical protein
MSSQSSGTYRSWATASSTSRIWKNRTTVICRRAILSKASKADGTNNAEVTVKDGGELWQMAKLKGEDQKVEKDRENNINGRTRQSNYQYPARTFFVCHLTHPTILTSLAFAQQ